MGVEIYWVRCPPPGQLGLGPHPEGGPRLKKEVGLLRKAGVDVLVSLLELHEVKELLLEEEPEICRAAGIEFLGHPLPDYNVPSPDGLTEAFIRSLTGRYCRGKAIAVHCRAGIGRSAIISAGVLLTLGLKLNSVLERLCAARGTIVPATPEQLAWVERFAGRVS